MMTRMMTHPSPRRIAASLLVATLLTAGCGTLRSWLGGPVVVQLEGLPEVVTDSRPHLLRARIGGEDGEGPAIDAVTSSAPHVLQVDAQHRGRCLSSGAATLSATTARGIAKTTVRCQVRACLVLSVGGFGALSQVGAVSELQRRGLRFDCAYGNSMGAVLASLYAGHPDKPLQDSFEGLLAQYVELTKADAKEKLSGFGIVKYAAQRIVDKIRGQRTIIVPMLSNDRLRRAVDAMLQSRTFEQLPVPFATSHKEVDDEGPHLVVQRQGNVAAAVASSANHPLLGGKLELQRVDPGIDALEAVPIASACRFAKDAALWVLNASGGPSVVPAGMGCAVQELVLAADGDKRALTDPEMRKEAYNSGKKQVAALLGAATDSVAGGEKNHRVASERVGLRSAEGRGLAGQTHRP